jgi:hypothetical protein
VSYHDVESAIQSEHYFTAKEGVAGRAHLEGMAQDGTSNGWFAPAPLQLLTFCVLVLKNGFTVTGESACVDPAEFNAAMGKQLARDHAFSKVWPLLGYALKDEMYKEAK